MLSPSSGSPRLGLGSRLQADTRERNGGEKKVREEREGVGEKRAGEGGMGGYA